jgi:hypothetical protein
MACAHSTVEEREMKGKLLAASIATIGCALAAGSAGAGELFSARLGATDAQTLVCSAVNVGRKDVQMEVELFETGQYDGTPADPVGTSFPPGATTSASSVGPITAFCRLTYSGNKKNVRAVILVSEDNSVVATLPLQ